MLDYFEGGVARPPYPDQVPPFVIGRPPSTPSGKDERMEGFGIQRCRSERQPLGALPTGCCPTSERRLLSRADVRAPADERLGLVACRHSLEIYANDGFQATVTSPRTAIIRRIADRPVLAPATAGLLRTGHSPPSPCTTDCGRFMPGPSGYQACDFYH